MDDKTLQIFTDIASQIGELNGHIKGVLGTLKNHESRIQSLEKKSGGHGDVVHMLLKCLLYALGIIGGLTGAGAILQNLAK